MKVWRAIMALYDAASEAGFAADKLTDIGEEVLAEAHTKKIKMLLYDITESVNNMWDIIERKTENEI